MATQTKTQVSNIFVNKQKFETTSSSLLGSEILGLAGLSSDEYDLFLVRGEGKSDKVPTGERVEIRNGLHFNAISKRVNFG